MAEIKVGANVGNAKKELDGLVDVLNKVVDAVNEVVQMPGASIEPPPPTFILEANISKELANWKIVWSFC